MTFWTVLTCTLLITSASSWITPFEKVSLKTPCKQHGTNEEGVYEKERNCGQLNYLNRIGREDEAPPVVGVIISDREAVVCCIPRVARSPSMKSHSVRLTAERTKCGIYCLNSEFHVIEGEKSGIKEFPHMAAVGYYNEEKMGPQFKCGGTLISDRFVLTAAHCANRNLDTPYLVRLGRTSLDLHDKNDPGEAFDSFVKKIYLPTEYKAREKDHDIALLELETPVTFTQEVCERIHPACLPKDEEIISEDRNFTVIGFGRMFRENSTTSSWLLKAQVTEYPLKQCKTKFLGSSTIQDGQICAYDPIYNKDTCLGDSGSSMTTKGIGVHYIHGVTSFGNGCGGDFPSVYTRVSKYLPWIESIVWP